MEERRHQFITVKGLKGATDLCHMYYLMEVIYLVRDNNVKFLKGCHLLKVRQSGFKSILLFSFFFLKDNKINLTKSLILTLSVSLFFI